MGTSDPHRGLNTKGAHTSSVMENIPEGWHATGSLYDIPILRPNSEGSLSLPRNSKIPNVSYLLYGKNGAFKQLRIFGEDNKPKMDIDYHIKNGKMSLHKHIYIDGVRQKEHIDLTPTEYDTYKKFIERVFDK